MQLLHLYQVILSQRQWTESMQIHLLHWHVLLESKILEIHHLYVRGIDLTVKTSVTKYKPIVKTIIAIVLLVLYLVKMTMDYTSVLDTTKLEPLRTLFLKDLL